MNGSDHVYSNREHNHFVADHTIEVVGSLVDLWKEVGDDGIPGYLLSMQPHSGVSKVHCRNVVVDVDKEN